MRIHTDQRYTQQIFHAFRDLSKTIHQLAAHILRFVPALDRSDPLINIQLLVFVDNIALRNESIHIQIDRCDKINDLFLPFH